MAETLRSAEPLARAACNVLGLDADKWWGRLRGVDVQGQVLETTWSSPLEFLAALGQLYRMCLAALSPSVDDAAGLPRAEATYNGKDGPRKHIKVTVDCSRASVRVGIDPREREKILQALQQCLA